MLLLAQYSLALFSGEVIWMKNYICCERFTKWRFFCIGYYMEYLRLKMQIATGTDAAYTTICTSCVPKKYNSSFRNCILQNFKEMF